MSLESKAKTAIQIAYDYFSIPQKIDNSPWVPLEIAQKLEAENKLRKQNDEISIKIIANLEKQIAEANKILNEPDWKTTIGVVTKIQRLREVLSEKTTTNHSYRMEKYESIFSK